MARRKSAAQQALKDMLEEELNISVFISQINVVHRMNRDIDIIERYERIKPKPKSEVKVEVSVKFSNYMPPEVYKPAPKRRYTFINGCMCLFDDYDND